MKKRNYRSWLSVLLCASMIAGLTACGEQKAPESSNSTEPSKSSETTQSKEKPAAPVSEKPVTITYSGTDPSVIPGVQDNEVTRYIKDKLNIELNVMSMTPEQMSTSMASGDLPDIFQVSSSNGLTVEDFIRGNLIMEMDDLVEQYGENIKKNVPEMLNYTRKYKSNDTGKLYALTTSVTVNNPEFSSPSSNYGVGMFLRWDYYKELGYPSVNGEDELLAVIKKMQEAHPTTADGKPVYGFSGWTDWGLWPYFVPYAFNNGWMNGVGYVIGPNGEVQSMFGEDADVFRRAMLFMNKANRMGLCDPEMFTMKNTDYIGKMANLQLLTAPCNWWNGDAGAKQKELGVEETGFYQIPGTFPAVWAGDYQRFGASDRPTVISANCKTPDSAMKLLDYLYSYEGSRLLISGIEGVHWETVGGKKEYLDATLQKMRDDTNFYQESGISLYGNMIGLSGSSFDEQGDYLGLGSTDKAISFFLTEDTAYCKYYDVKYPAQAFSKLEAEGKVKANRFDTTWMGMMKPLDSDMQMINAQCNNYYATLVAKLVNSKDDADFNKNWDSGVAELNAMGYDKFYETIQRDAAEAVQKVEELKK